jgi:ABC-2 type transport system permease protein
MIASARAELLRLGRWPVTWVVIGVWLALNLSFGYLFDYLSYREAVDGGNQRLAEGLLAQLAPAGVPATMVSGLPMFGGALVLILAALATGSGYSWNTWKTVFTQGPGRLSVLAGTMLGLAALLILMAAVTLVVDLQASSVVMAAAGQDLTRPGLGDLAQGLGGALGIIAMWAAAGAVIGLLARSPALAVGLGLVWMLVVENLLRGVASLLGPLEPLTDVLPGTAAGSLAGAVGAATESEAGGAPGVLTVLNATQSISLLALYLIAFLAIAALVVTRRDA